MTKRATIKCEQVCAADLQPGDLFSVVGDEYWSRALDIGFNGSIGERVYVRTHVSADHADDAHSMIYRLTIHVSDGDDNT